MSEPGKPARLPLPEEVFVSQTETLPRRLVGQCAKRGCRRCGGQGWFRFAHTANAWICPCAQAAAYDRIAKARAEVKNVPPLEMVQRTVAQLLVQELVPAVLLCSTAIGAALRNGVPDGPSLPKPWPLVVASEPEVTLSVYEDDDAPPLFGRVFTAEEFEPYKGDILEKWSAAAADQVREATAKAELERQRAELVKPL